MRLGKEAMEALQAEITGRLRAGDELVVAGAAALKGTALITEHRYNVLEKQFSQGFLKSAMSLYADYGVGEPAVESMAWKLAGEAGASARYAMGKGGFLSALWKMAEASQVGLRVDLRKVPIRQETIEICEVFDLNPYRLFSEGAILIGISSGAYLAEELKRMGLMAAVIGQTNEENDRLLYSGEHVRFLDRPGEDEIKGVLDLWQD